MKYKVIEVRVFYKDEKINVLYVLWESNPDGSTRATYISKGTMCGYKTLLHSDVLNDDLIQECCATGITVTEEMKKRIFPSRHTKNYLT